jgi:glycolate oxidase FAD binding subunit
MLRSEAEVAAAVRDASEQGRRLVPRGGATKLGWGLETAGDELDLRGLDRVVALEPGDFVCVAQAGVRLADLQAELAAHGPQRLMLDPPYGPDQTLGGILASNAAGPLRHRYGAPRDLVIGARFVLSDGTVAKTGGRVVKNVAGFDLARLLCGSLGTLAVITEVAFRLHPAPPASATVALESRDAGALTAFAERIRRAPLATAALELAWPDGIVAARFDSTSEGAPAMARSARELAEGVQILDAAGADALWARLTSRPWDGEGAIVAVGVPLSRLADLLALCDRLDAALALRAGTGVGEVRVAAGQIEELAAGVAALQGHLAPRRGGHPEPRRDDASLALMQAVKAQFDPAGVLSPGRLWSAA